MEIFGGDTQTTSASRMYRGTTKGGKQVFEESENHGRINRIACAAHEKNIINQKNICEQLLQTCLPVA